MRTGVVTASAVVLVAVGAGGVALGRATAPTSRSASPTTPVPATSRPTTAPSSTTSASTTTTVVSGSGSAGVFAGQWEVHAHLLVIDPTGYGILDWRTYATCGRDPPPCDIFSGNDIIDGGHATLSLAAAGPTTASGTVLTTTVPDEVPVGRFTATLDASRDLLQLSLPLFANYPLCGPRARALSVAQQNAEGINCGA